MKLLHFVVLIFSLSCANVKKWSVAKIVDDKTAEVYMDKNEVKVGDKIETFFYDCSQRMVPISHCLHTSLGEGTVIRTLDKNHSVVKFKEGSIVREGSFVRKL